MPAKERTLIEGAIKKARHTHPGTAARRSIYRHRFGKMRASRLFRDLPISRMARTVTGMRRGDTARLSASVVHLLNQASEAVLGRTLGRAKLVLTATGAKGVTPKLLRLVEAMSAVGFQQ
jgi:histone H3/H4